MTGIRLGVGSDADLLMSTVAALMWAVVLWRTPTARHPGPGRILWCALACLAVAQTLQVLIVYQTVDRALGAPGSAANIKHLLALASAACVRALVSQLADERLRSVASAYRPGRYCSWSRPTCCGRRTCCRPG